MAKKNSTPNPNPAIVSAFKVFVESHNTNQLLGKLAAAGVNISNQIAVLRLAEKYAAPTYDGSGGYCPISGTYLEAQAEDFASALSAL